MFTAAERMFATLSPEGGALPHVSFKASSESVHLLTETGRFVPAPYIARTQGVTTDHLDALTASEWHGYLTRAWRLIVLLLRKWLRTRLLAAGGVARMRV